MSQPAIDTRPVCVVTGAAGLLGSAFCRRFAARYRIVAVWNRRRPLLPTQSQYLFDPLDPDHSLPVNTHPVFDVRADLTNDAAVDRLVGTVLKRLGQVDLLVNAAVDSQWAPLVEGFSSVAASSRVFTVNVAAPLALTATVARRAWQSDPTTNRRRNRCVLNVSSTAGTYVYPGYGQGVYSASKAALDILSRHLAAELDPLGVRVNVLAPDTFPGRVAVPEVLDAMRQLLDGRRSGEVVLQLAAGGEHARTS